MPPTQQTGILHSFSTPKYSGVWFVDEGDRNSLRARIELYLREALMDPSGRLEVRPDGPHWVGVPVALSYSQSLDRALLVYSRTCRALGVDIEREDRKFMRSPEELARRFFHPSEVSLARQPQVFLELWCQKEALGKWCRGGLSASIGKRWSDWESESVQLAPLPVAPVGWVAWLAWSE